MNLRCRKECSGFDDKLEDFLKEILPGMGELGGGGGRHMWIMLAEYLA